MKTKTVGKSAVILSCAILLTAALSAMVALAVPKRDSSGTLSHAQISAAATPEPGPVAPVKRVNCPLCGGPGGGGDDNQAYLIDSAECLRWLFDNARTPAELSACYVLDLPEVAAGGESVKYLDVTGWSDTAVGACALAEPSNNHACPNAFTGHFYGGNCTLKFAFTKDATRSNFGGLGLFPCMLGAKISALNLDVTVDAGGPNNGNLDGPVGSYAGNGALIEGVSVEQRFVQRETDVPATDKVPAHKSYDSTHSSAGIVGFCDDARVENCRVTSLPNVYENGAEVAKTRLFYYGGIAFANNGAISNCAYAYRGGDNGVLETMGGITYDNCGEITDSYAEVYANGVTGIAVGGITCVLNGGAIVSCVTRMNVDALLGEDGRTSVRIGGLVADANWPRREYLNGGAMRIENCRVTGGSLAGNMAGGLVAHVSNGTGGDNAGFLCYPVEIANCEVTLTSVGTLNPEVSTANCGGLVGLSTLSYDLAVTDCTTTANVFGWQNVGGAFGSVQYANAPSGESGGGVSFTVTNCHSYANMVNAVKTDVISGAGGFLGNFLPNTRTAEDASTLIAQCTTRASVTAYGSCAGGFIGNVEEREIAVKPVGREYTLLNCAAYGDVSVLGPKGVTDDQNTAYSGNSGGFIGRVGVTTAANVSVKGCSASGNVTGSTPANVKLDHMGGFIGLTKNSTLELTDCVASGNVDGRGGVGGFTGLMENAKRVERCEARGTVTAAHGSGSFIGHIMGVTVKDCRAYGDILRESSNLSAFNRGGFFGLGGRSCVFENCVAFGSVVGDSQLGGFGGNLSLGADGNSTTFINCKAYGNTVSTGENAAGFVGLVTGAGTVRFTDCTAYGDATSSIRGSGFVALTDWNVKFLSFTRCAAYGDGTSTQIGNGSEAGGFGGWIRGAGAEFLNCTAAGSVLNGDGVTGDNADCGGFIGLLSVKSTIDGCRASAERLLGGPTTTGTLLGGCYEFLQPNGAENVLMTPDGSVIKNCRYRTLGNIPMIGSGSVYGTASRIDKVDAKTNNAADNSAVAGGAPSLTCTIAKSAANNDIIIAFANLANISGYVTELAVSADGGKTYTQLIYTSADKAYDGYVLTPVAGVGIGGKLQAQAFSYTLKNLGAYDKNKVVVRISFSNGYSVVTRGSAA